MALAIGDDRREKRTIVRRNHRIAAAMRVPNAAELIWGTVVYEIV